MYVYFGRNNSRWPEVLCLPWVPIWMPFYIYVQIMDIFDCLFFFPLIKPPCITCCILWNLNKPNIWIFHSKLWFKRYALRCLFMFRSTILQPPGSICINALMVRFVVSPIMSLCIQLIGLLTMFSVL